jgi:hypothetical protein
VNAFWFGSVLNDEFQDFFSFFSVKFIFLSDSGRINIFEFDIKTHKKKDA